MKVIRQWHGPAARRADGAHSPRAAGSAAWRTGLAMLALGCGLAAHAAKGAGPTADPAGGGHPSREALQPFSGEAQLRDVLLRWQQRALELAPRRARATGGAPMPSAAGNIAQAEAAQAAAPAGMSLAKSAAPMVTAAPAAPAAAGPAGAIADSITNVQTAGVDEGGIVKQAGDYLVVLRRGRLFTVHVGGDQLAAADVADAFGPGIDPARTWYDELLVAGRAVVVIGYSVSRGGTEIGLFELSADGRLAHRSTWHLRGSDYYSSRNFASRLVGDELVFYTPSTLYPGAVSGPWEGAPWMPGVRRWHPSGAAPDFRRLLPATRIYRTDDEFDPSQPLALHTVTRCRIALPELACESSAVLGPRGREFYVSGTAVYVWTHAQPGRSMTGFDGSVAAGPARGEPAAASAVFRLPFDGGAPGALKTSGVPVDALSFSEDASEHLNVLLRRAAPGWRAAAAEADSSADLALLRVPLAAFGDGRRAAGRQHYRGLPSADAGPLHNRHVGPWLLWGSATGTQAWAVRTDAASAVQRLPAGHRIERIEALGEHAVLVGSRGDSLQFSAVRLGRGDGATLAGQHVVEGVRSAESRTHGFFYRAGGDRQGLLGLPVVPSTPRAGWGAGPQRSGAAAVVFLRQRDLQFAALGELRAQARPGNDHCRASCVDWYGQARPIFLGHRILALLGYELVEGVLDGGFWRETLEERRRIDFTPMQARDDGRYWPS